MIFATGSNFFGQLGIGIRKRENLFVPTPFGCSEEHNLDPDSVEDIQCGNQFTVVLSKSGSLSFCGNVHSQVSGVLLPIQIPLPVVCRQVACGRKHILALMEKGVVMSWGVGYFGQLGHGDDSSWENPRMVAALDPRRLGARVVRVACGGSHSGALTESGKVFMWGLNRGGQCGTNSKADSVLEPKPIDTAELGAATKIASLVLGRGHSALTTSTGRVFVWGEASYGRLGVALEGGRKKQASPVELTAFRNIPIHSVASGDFHMLALAHDGSVFSWGYSADGQTGQSSLLNVRTPRRLEFFDALQVAAVECGASWSLAVSTSGQLYAWGYGDGGWLGLRPRVQMAVLDSDHVTPADASRALPHVHACSFDSRHNVLSPERIDFLADWRVLKVRGGGAHTIIVCSEAALVAESSVRQSVVEAPSAIAAESGSGKTLSSSGSSRSGSFREVSSRADAKGRPPSAGGSKASARRQDSLSPAATRAEPKDGASLRSAASYGDASSPTIVPDRAVDAVQLVSWARNGKVGELTAALAGGACVDAQDSAGNTPLIVACQTGSLAVVQLLAAHGAALDLANARGNTALHYAFNYGYEALGQLLIARGADEFLLNKEGLTCYEGLSRADLDLL